MRTKNARSKPIIGPKEKDTTRQFHPIHESSIPYFIELDQDVPRFSEAREANLL